MPLYESVLYMKINNSDILLICLYVNDLIFIDNNPIIFEEFKRIMVREFEMADIDLMSYFLGIEVKESNEEICIS